MTADEARALSREAVTPDNTLVQAVLGTWHAAIRRACQEGRHLVRESEGDRLRTPVPAAVHRAVRERLVADGFAVRYVTEEYNLVTCEVSWPEPAGRIIPPQGGSGVRSSR
jgi:hypothetical protein